VELSEFARAELSKHEYPRGSRSSTRFRRPPAGRSSAPRSLSDDQSRPTTTPLTGSHRSRGGRPVRPRRTQPTRAGRRCALRGPNRLVVALGHVRPRCRKPDPRRHPPAARSVRAPPGGVLCGFGRRTHRPDHRLGERLEPLLLRAAREQRLEFLADRLEFGRVVGAVSVDQPSRPVSSQKASQNFGSSAASVT